jgi:hypothetical protein
MGEKKSINGHLCGKTFFGGHLELIFLYYFLLCRRPAGGPSLDRPSGRSRDGRPQGVERLRLDNLDPFRVTAPGGETNNIEEATIASLFASGYETKPALSVPIHIVDGANVPAELKVDSVIRGTLNGE